MKVYFVSLSNTGLCPFDVPATQTRKAFTFTVVNLTRAFTAGNTLVLPVVTVLLLIWTAFTFTVVNLTRAFTAGNTLVLPAVTVPCIFQVFVPTRVPTDPGHGTRICWALLLPNVMEIGAFSWCYFY